MSKKKAIGLGVLVIVFSLVIGGFFKFTRKKRAAIQIESIPRATVFLNGREVGTTPYQNEEIEPGEIDLKLVPEATDAAEWERRLTVNPNTRVFVNKKFASEREKEELEIIYLEKTRSKEKAGLILTSIPDGVAVTVDGEMRGFAPLNLEEIGAGDHRLGISHPGYRSKELLVRALAGYRLVIEVKLAQEEEKREEESEKESEKEVPQEELEKPYVIIGDTPTGWLRVRMGPSLGATEAAKVNPGEKYPLLDEEGGWYKIRYQQDKEGWISSRYAKKVEE